MCMGNLSYEITGASIGFNCALDGDWIFAGIDDFFQFQGKSLNYSLDQCCSQGRYMRT